MSVRKVGRLMALAILMLSAPGCAETAPPSPAFERVQGLQRTINVWRWFGRSEMEPLDHYADYLSDGDLRQIRGWGFTAIRLPLGEPFIFEVIEDGSSSPEMRALDAAIARIHAAGLNVIIDFHIRKRARVEDDATYRQAILQAWGLFAGHFAGAAPDHLFLELMNEPKFINNDITWRNYQMDLLKVVRHKAPKLTLLATSNNYSNPRQLARMRPLPDHNVIYTFHFYEPLLFTSQGAEFTKKDARRSVRGLVWPGDGPSCRQSLARMATEARRYVEPYCSKGWDRAQLRRELAPVVEWARSYDVPLFIGEFGVRAQEAPQDSRLRWLSDAAAVFAENDLAWGLWSYDDCFGLGLRGSCDASTPYTGNLACPTLQAIGLAAQGCLPPTRAAKPD